MTGKNSNPANGSVVSVSSSNPTFSTRNQSKRKLVTLLMAAVFLVLLVSVVVLYKRHRHEEIYKGHDRSQLPSRGRSNRGGNSDLGFLSSKSQSRSNDNEASESSDSESNNSDNSETDLKNRKPFYSDDDASVKSSVVNVPMNGGPVRGQTRRKSNSGMNSKEVTSFLGLPYAAAPVEELRFEPPANAKKWTSLKEAVYQPPKCPQGAYLFSSITESKNTQAEESEDCLYLNIWTPSSGSELESPAESGSKHPVLVYLHSGLFSFGSIGTPDLDPSALVAAYEVVVVTVQYRLGPFGWATFDPQTETGNKTGNHSDQQQSNSLGLQDQAKALEWINQNIAAFGGDPARVTLAGHGSGAVAVAGHLLNSKTNKHFQRVIVQGLDNLWNIGLYGVAGKASVSLLTELGCELTTQATPKSVRKCLKKAKLSTKDVIETFHYMMEHYAVPFGPSFGAKLEVEVVAAISNSLNLTAGQRPSIKQLVTLFDRWNVFPKHIELMIGLSSDDDYKLEAINRHKEADFEDEDEDEDEDERGEDKNKENYKEVDGGNNKTSKKKDNIKKSKSKTPSEVEKEEEVAEENSTEDVLNSSSSTVLPAATEVTTSVDDLITMTTIAEDMPSSKNPSTRSLFQRRRKRQNIASSMNHSQPIFLDADERIKLCRLVALYKALKQKSSDENAVSRSIYLYRVDPKVLTSPLEEVSLAFGSRQKLWLTGFDEAVMSLWGSFVRMGDFSQISKIGLDYSSQLETDVDSDQVALINLGQKEDKSFSSADEVVTTVKPPRESTTYQSELKVATLDKVSSALCAGY